MEKPSGESEGTVTREGEERNKGEPEGTVTRKMGKGNKKGRREGK